MDPTPGPAQPDADAVALPATLTRNEARAVLQALAPRLAASAHPVLDASALQVLDSAALAVLLDCRRQALASGRTLQVRHAPPKLGQLARLYGVDALLGV